ncbi:unnamed protein product [Ectocarpus sp. 8 AP-2014]
MIQRISAAVPDWIFSTPRNKLESEETPIPMRTLPLPPSQFLLCSLRDPSVKLFFPGTPVAVADKPSPPCLAAGGARVDLSLRFTVSTVSRDASPCGDDAGLATRPASCRTPNPRLAHGAVR